MQLRPGTRGLTVLLALMTNESGAGFRDIFLRTFTLDQHLASLAEAFLHIGPENPTAEPAAAVRTSSS